MIGMFLGPLVGLGAALTGVLVYGLALFVYDHVRRARWAKACKAARAAQAKQAPPPIPVTPAVPRPGESAEEASDRHMELWCDRTVRREGTFICFPRGADPREVVDMLKLITENLTRHLDEGEALAREADEAGGAAA